MLINEIYVARDINIIPNMNIVGHLYNFLFEKINNAPKYAVRAHIKE